MVTINGKEYGMEYNARARIECSNWLAAHEDTASIDEYRFYRAVSMINAYNIKNGIPDRIKANDLLNISHAEFEALLKAEQKQFDFDTAVTVEAEPKKGKNVKSPEKSN